MKDSVIVVDRAYVDFDLLYHWNLNDAYFVSRQKSNAAFKIVEEKQVPQTTIPMILRQPILIHISKQGLHQKILHVSGKAVKLEDNIPL